MTPTTMTPQAGPIQQGTPGRPRMVATGRRNLPPAPDAVRYVNDSLARELLWAGIRDETDDLPGPATLHCPHLAKAYEEGREVVRARRAVQP